MTSAVKWTGEFSAGIVAGSGIGIGLTWWILEEKLGLNPAELTILATTLMSAGALLARRAQNKPASKPWTRADRSVARGVRSDYNK